MKNFVKIQQAIDSNYFGDLSPEDKIAVQLENPNLKVLNFKEWENLCHHYTNGSEERELCLKNMFELARSMEEYELVYYNSECGSKMEEKSFEKINQD